MPERKIALTVNGALRELEAAPGATLLEVLRGPLGLTGAKGACGRGECGACTVLVDGTPVLACLSLAQRTRGAVTTVEGLASECADLREAFADLGGFQCGYCTSGQIVRAAALLRAGLPAEDAAAESLVRYEMSGNICRCTGYNGIVDAVLRTAARRRAAPSPKAAP
ncbi:MAG TPA: (2Fe-2S)-binding protein [Alphaproteobacteria bacterium]|nr:(2Fe-2S)-binding protein [Alphaproteobacteria bacterium]